MVIHRPCCPTLNLLHAYLYLLDARLKPQHTSSRQLSFSPKCLIIRFPAPLTFSLMLTEPHPLPQMAVTCVALGPLAPSEISNSTFWPSASVLKPLPSMAEKCTNTCESDQYVGVALGEVMLEGRGSIHVFRSVGRGDEAETFALVEPFHLAFDI